MPHIHLPEGFPGISSGFAFRPDTARPLRELAELLLRGPSSLSIAEREMIAVYVSNLNGCAFCRSSHRAAAAYSEGGSYALVDAVCSDFQSAPVSERFKSLLTIAARVQQGGKFVTSSDIAVARQYGATDREIHDAVLIASAICMYNRYVDGLAAHTPTDIHLYDEMGSELAAAGYLQNSNAQASR